jgi:hypothetical protein
VKGSVVNRAQTPRAMNRPSSARSLEAREPREQPEYRELGFVASFGYFFKRTLDEDLIVRGDAWLRESGVQQQLEHQGFQLRWVASNKLISNFGEGWLYVTVPHHLWWKRRVRRRYGAQNQYLLKKTKSFRSQTGY